MFLCGNHRRQLIKIAPELFKRSANLIFIQFGNRPLLNYFALSILGVGCHAEHKRSGVFFILAHEQILNLRPASHGEQEQASGNRIERAAVTDLPCSQFSPS